jgi:hypothetical protein
MRYLPILFVAVFAVGCCSRCKDQSSTRYHEDGRAKPVAAMPAIIDTTSFDVSWSISEELTSAIAQMISRGGQIIIQSQDDFAIASNPFGGDLSWMKREFQNQEFAVFLELVEHEFVPSSNNPSDREYANNLKMGIRVRVIDLRGSDPKIVLQEMIRDSYYIPKTYFPVDYNTVTWGTEDYKDSPMGTAHAKIAQEVALRVSEYILLAKSR